MSKVYEGSYFGTIQGPCSKCNRTCTTELTEPGTDNPLCTNCFDQEYSKEAQRDKKLEHLLQLSRISNKKWWQFWIR